jgi:hypothetical protein
LLSLVLLVAAGCSRQRTPTEAKALLVGDWSLHIGSDCTGYDVASDKLILHSDGTFEQHTVSKRGYRYDALAEKWDLISDHSVFLDSRKDFFNSQSKNGFVGAKRSKDYLWNSRHHPSFC